MIQDNADREPGVVVQQRPRFTNIAEIRQAHKARLRQRIASLERLQAQRIALVEQKKESMDLVVANKALELDNLKAQLTIGVVA